MIVSYIPTELGCHYLCPHVIPDLWGNIQSIKKQPLSLTDFSDQVFVVRQDNPSNFLEFKE